MSEPQKQVLVLSIEPKGGETFIHGFHLGTDLKMAKLIASIIFHGRNDSPLERDFKGRIMRTQTVAIKQGDEILDVYDGRWASEGYDD